MKVTRCSRFPSFLWKVFAAVSLTATFLPSACMEVTRVCRRELKCGDGHRFRRIMTGQKIVKKNLEFNCGKKISNFTSSSLERAVRDTWGGGGE